MLIETTRQVRDYSQENAHWCTKLLSIGMPITAGRRTKYLKNCKLKTNKKQRLDQDLSEWDGLYNLMFVKEMSVSEKALQRHSPVWEGPVSVGIFLPKWSPQENLSSKLCIPRLLESETKPLLWEISTPHDKHTRIVICRSSGALSHLQETLEVLQW